MKLSAKNLSLIFALALLASCSKKQMPHGQFSAPVTVAQVTQKDVPAQIEAVGNVEPYSTVSVKAMVSGEVMQVHFREGQNVKKGDPLFTIDPRPFQMDLEKNQANYAKDLAQAKNAETEVKRYASLIHEGYVSQEQLDQVQTNARALEATLGVDKSGVDNAKLQLQYCFIHSPIDGQTGSLLIHQGNLIKANDTPNLVVINQVQPIYVTFSVPQEQLSEIKKYRGSNDLKVEAVPANATVQPEIGKISFIDNNVDTSTGTVKIKGIFKNDRKLLWPGQFANVTLTLHTEQNAVVIPTEAVQTGQQGSYVFVVGSDMTAQIRPVVIERTQYNETVIKQGLKAGETVVIDGQLMLGPGSKVFYKESAENKKEPGRTP